MEDDINYYEHHLGDYDGATAHLSWLEDCAYRRLLGLYYRAEAPIPADIKQACRLVRAASKPEREAVEQVLREFFELREDGWHNARCDADIDSYRDAEPDRIAKREHAKERQRRARERRRDLFEALRRHDKVPAWDTHTKTLESLLQQCESRAASTPVTAPVTRDSTATDTAPVTPVTREDTATHTHFPLPIPTSQINKTPSESGRGSRLPPDWTPGPDGIAFAASLGITNGRAVAEMAKFRDFWVAKSGKDATKVDWQATWRNWLRRSVEGHPRSGSAVGHVDPFAGAL